MTGMWKGGRHGTVVNRAPRRDSRCSTGSGLMSRRTAGRSRGRVGAEAREHILLMSNISNDIREFFNVVTPMLGWAPWMSKRALQVVKMLVSTTGRGRTGSGRTGKMLRHRFMSISIVQSKVSTWKFGLVYFVSLTSGL